MSLPVSLPLTDLSAVVLLFAVWFGIGWFTERPPAGKPSVSVLMTRFRREWMMHFLARDPRIFDGNILTSLRDGTAFFASACMIATGGILALIGNNAFLKFVWAHRLFGYCAIMMGAVPNDPDDPMARDRAMQAADLNITAARSFNAGLRSVYFALGSLGWLAGPWILMLGTGVVLFVTWRREFASTSRQVIMRSLPPPRLPDHARLPLSGPPPPQP